MVNLHCPSFDKVFLLKIRKNFQLFYRFSRGFDPVYLWYSFSPLPLQSKINSYRSFSFNFDIYVLIVFFMSDLLAINKQFQQKRFHGFLFIYVYRGCSQMYNSSYPISTQHCSIERP